MEIKLDIHFRWPTKKFLLYLGATIVIVAIIFFAISRAGSSSIPTTYRQQATFKTVSAPKDIVKADSYHYSSGSKTLAFNLQFQGQDFSVTEQPAPETLTTGTGVYFQSLGLHPIAQFQVKAGPVAILNFYQTGTLAKAGTSGMLVAGKTMVIVTLSDPQKTITNDQWKQLFDSLQLDK